MLSKLNTTEFKQKLKGVIAVTITPFSEDYSVDFAAVKKNVQFLLTNGAESICPCGSVGEFSSLSLEEYGEIVKTTVKTVNGKVPVIAGASHSGTQECVHKAKIAEESGADAIMTVPPYYLKPSWEGLLEHYRMLSTNISIPLTVYNNPDFSKVNITPPKCLELVEKVDRIAGIKETSGNMFQFYETLRLCRNKTQVIMGKESTAFYGLACGAPGFVSSMINFAPQIPKKLYNAFHNGNLDEAREVQEQIGPYMSFVGGLIQQEKIPYVMPVVKEAMNLLGLPAGTVRPPTMPLSGDDRERLKRILAGMKLLSASQLSTPH